MRGLLFAELFVRAQLREEAELEKEAAAVSNLLRGTGRVIQGTSSALGQGLEREIGGLTGTALRGGAEAAPTVLGVAAGGYGVDTALGNPVSKWLKKKKQQVKARMQGAAAFDPRTGQWY